MNPVRSAAPAVQMAAAHLPTVGVLLSPYGLSLCQVAAGAVIPGSYWGAPEAGLIGNELFVRSDTPLHSLLHEACHYVCMSASRRAGVHTDAGGNYDEENGVCYLQIVLAERLAAGGGASLCADMDAWGYTFRLGSARAWFDADAEDARAWLYHHGLLAANDAPSFRLRA